MVIAPDEPSQDGPPPLDVGGRGRDAVLQMLGRTVVMRVITVLGTIVLARILSVADFGVFAVLIVWLGLLMMLGDAGIAASLVQQKHEPTREEMGTAWVLQSIIWIPFVVILWFLAPVIAQVLSLPSEFEWQLRAISFSIPLTLLRALPAAMLGRVLRFRALATIEVIQHIAFYATAITMALAGGGAWSLVGAVFASTGVGALLVNLFWGRRPVVSFDPAIARHQLRFGVSYQASNLVASTREWIVPIFGSIGGGGATAIGHLQFGFRIGQQAATIDEIIGRVTFPAFSRLQHDPPRIARLMTDAVLVAGLAVAIVQVWLIAVAPVLVPIVYGDRWVPAVPVLQLVCLGTLATVPTRFLRSLVFGQGRSRVGFGLAVAVTFTMLAAFPPLVILLGVGGGGLAFVLAASVGLVLYARAVSAVATFPWLALGRLYLLAAVAGMAAWLIATGLSGTAGLITATVAYGLIGAALVWLFARGEVALTLRLLRRREPIEVVADI
ncbi:MAG: oligosaccharide flippase family protein [Candidatus Limnocylindrales bacterium]